MHNLESPLLPSWEDYDEESYVQLGNCSNKSALVQFSMTLLQEQFQQKWSEHLGDIKVYSSNFCALIMKRTLWDKLPVLEQIQLAARAKGFCEGVSAVSDQRPR